MALTSNARRIDATDIVGPRLAKCRGYIKRYDNLTQLSAEFTCANGLYFGVRVGRKHMCWPKNDKGPWTHVEVVNPNRNLYSLEQYRTDNSPHARTICYDSVPVELLNQLIARNGGLK